MLCCLCIAERACSLLMGDRLIATAMIRGGMWLQIEYSGSTCVVYRRVTLLWGPCVCVTPCLASGACAVISFIHVMRYPDTAVVGTDKRFQALCCSVGEGGEFWLPVFVKTHSTSL